LLGVNKKKSRVFASTQVFSVTVDDSGKAIAFLERATLAQNCAGWLKLVTKVPFDIGKPQFRPPRCDTWCLVRQ